MRCRAAVLLAEHEEDPRAVVEGMERPVVPQAGELAPGLAAVPEDVSLRLELARGERLELELESDGRLRPGSRSSEKIDALALRKAMILS